MDRPERDSQPLYLRLLGAESNRLAEPVRRFHDVRSAVLAEGLFEVRRGRNPLARLIAWINRMPADGDDVPVELLVTRNDGGEVWARQFGRRPLVSYQRASPDGLLIEEMGPLELRFTLTATDGGVEYRSRRSSLRLGPLRLSIPGWFAPIAVASEKVNADGERIDIHVEVCLPLIGRLIRYVGTVKVIEDSR